MSSVDRITINRPEPDNFLAEERRRQLARQHQLQLRETSRLVLPSVEMQSRLASKRTLDGRRHERDLESASTAIEEEVNDGDRMGPDLLGLALDVGRNASTMSVQQDGRTGIARLDDERNDVGYRASHTSTTREENAPPTTALQQGEEAELESAGTDAKPVETAKFADFSLSQKLEIAFAQSRSTASLAAANVLEDLIEQLMHDVQTNALQSESLAPELEAALDTLSEQRKSAFVMNPDSAETSRLEGSYRFLAAFLETKRNLMQGRLEASRNFSAENSGIDGAAEQMASVANEKDEVNVLNSESDRDNIVTSPERHGPAKESNSEELTPARDRKTLYEFLERLSSAAASSTPVALQHLAQARQTNPEKALLRLAASGDQAVALYAPEISRRMDLISARIERDGRKSARAGLLADAVETQKKWMDSVIAEADSIVGDRALSRRSDAEQRQKTLSETLPQLVLAKS